MDRSSTRALVEGAPTYEVKRRYAGMVTIVEDEREWRARHSGSSAWSVPKVGLTRRRSLAQGAREVSAKTPSDSHLVSIVMRNLNVRLSMSGRVMHDGGAIPGMLLVTRPTVAARCVFRGPVLHLHVPNSMIAEFNRDPSSRETVALCSEAALIRDAIAERLARILLAADDVGSPFRQLYADHVSNAIVVRLLAPRFPLSTRRKVAELSRWRLRRVAEYAEAHLAEPVSLRRSCLGGWSHAHAFRRPVQGRHRLASARVPPAPPDRTGAGDPRPRPCIDR